MKQRKWVLDQENLTLFFLSTLGFIYIFLIKQGEQTKPVRNTYENL